MSWNRVVGQTRVKRILEKIYTSRRIPGAFLFEGPEGVGKDAAAIEFAKALNCENGGFEPCDECSSCRAINILQHPNVRLVFPLPRGEGETRDDGPLDKLDAKTVRVVREEIAHKAADPYHKMLIPRAQVIKISSIREVIHEDSLSLYKKGYRVIIVIQAEELGMESANAVLKVLEEPSPHTTFILTTSKKNMLLPTIISRCQTIRFDLLKEDEIVSALMERLNIDEADARLKARLASGSLSKAMELFKTDILEMREESLEILREIYAFDYAKFSSRSRKFLEERDPVRAAVLLQMLQIWLRDAAIINYGLSDKAINLDRLEVLKKVSESFDKNGILQASARIDRSMAEINGNVNLALVFVNLFLDLSALLKKR
ncbi:MAG: ATP-binding protein [Candidatus Kryptoniota bacterium]